MKKQLYVKHFHCIPPSYGGVSVYVKRLSLALTKNGKPSGAYFSHKLEGVPEECRYLYDRYPKHIRSYLVLFELYRLLKSVKGYKLIHSHSSLNSSFAIWLIHKLYKLPIVYTVHNQMIEQELSVLNKLDRWCVKSLARDKKVKFVTVNQEGRDRLIKSGFEFKNSISIIPAYIKPVEIGEEKDYLKADLINFINEKPFILYYAQSIRYCEGKEVYGTEAMIDSFIDLKKVNSDISLVFCIAEPNDPKQMFMLKKRINDNGLNEHVYWQEGAISEMWPLIKKAKLYVRPTSTDGDSILIREVMSFGIPVLASDVCIRPQMCKTYHYGNTKELAVKIEDMLLSESVTSSSFDDFYGDICAIYNSLTDTK